MGAMDDELKKLSEAAEKAAKAEQDAMSAAEKANNDLLSEYNERTKELQEQAQQSNKATEEAGLSYIDMIGSWENAMRQHSQKLQEEAEAKNKKEQSAMKAGGLAGAASAIINLIGAAKGAHNQQQENFISNWQSRADAARRERDARLGSYRDQLRTLESQRALLKYNFAKGKAAADANLASLLAQRGDAAAQLKAAGVKEAATGKAKIAAGESARAAQVYNAALRAKQAAANALQTQIKAQEAAARINTEYSKQLANGYDSRTGKFYNPQTKKYDSDSFVTIPGKEDKSFSDFNASDWRGFRDTYAKHAGLKKGYKEYFELKKDKNYNKWVSEHPEEAQVLEWLESPLDLEKSDLEKLLIMQSVVDALSGEKTELGGVDPSSIPGATMDASKRFIGRAGALEKGNPVKNVDYDDEGKVNLP